MSKIKRIKDIGPYMVDELNRGTINDRTMAVVMDNTIVHKPGRPSKIKVKYFVTETPKFYSGQDTVALFNIKALKKRSSEEAAL